jgi:ISXO2-like transposase domain
MTCVQVYFSIFKRGMKGIYQHCAEKHLHRYLAEYDFRFNTRTALGSMTANVPRLLLRVPRASASRIVNLTKPIYKFRAARFLRRRRKSRRTLS